MTKRKVKSWMYMAMYVLPLIFVPIYIYGYSKQSYLLNFNEILNVVANAFKVDIIYGWLETPVALLVPNISSSPFSVYMISYFSYIILLTFIDILVDALLWIPNIVHDSIGRGRF